MTTIVKAANAAHFLSLVPQMLGFHPTRSLVLVPFAGSRSLGAMRLDLPTGDEDIDSFASTCLGLVCRIANADAVAAVVYTDDTFPGDRPPRDEVARALLARADACGLRMTDALCVGADAWGSYVDPECPPQGRPLADLGVAPVPGLGPVRGDQASGAQLPVVRPEEIDRVDRALVAMRYAIASVCSDAGPLGAQQHRRGNGRLRSSGDGAGGAVGARVDPQALAAVGLLDDLPSLFEDALVEETAARDTYRAAAMVWCLARPALRDIALVQWCSGLAAGDEALEAQLRWESGEQYPEHIAELMWGEGEQPDPTRLERALDLTRRTAAVAPRDCQPGALAACAWLSWALGRSTHAERYALTALDIEPGHGLSEIVMTFVAAGHLPDWAFRRPVRDRRPSRSGIAKKTPKRR